MKCELVKNWRFKELKRELLIWCEVDLGTTQFYAWLPYALITKKRIYNDRDRAKLITFGHFMKRYKRLEMARAKLIEVMQTYPENFPNEP